MAERSKPRLVEGPLCLICHGALDIIEVKTADGANVTFVHRDGDEYDLAHKARVTYKVLRP